MEKQNVFLVLVGVCLFASASAQAPSLISYQGKVVGSDGIPVTGAHGLQFDIYSSPTGGTSLWTETHLSVTITAGLFNVTLGETTPFGVGLFDSNPELWLEVTLDGSETFSRVRLFSVPFAIQAQAAEALMGVTATAAQLNELVGGGATTLHSHAPGDADTLDTLDSAQFLRSDVDDTCAGVIQFTGASTGMYPNQASVQIFPTSVDAGDSILSIYMDASTMLIVDDEANLTASGVMQAGTILIPSTYNRIGSGTPEAADVSNASDLYISDSLEIDDNLYVDDTIQVGKSTPDNAQDYSSITSESYTPVSGQMTSTGDLAIEFDLEVGDDVYVGGDITWPEKTRYYSITPEDCAVDATSSDFGRSYQALYKTAVDPWMVFYAPVHLPNGAIVTRLDVWYKDNHADNLTVSLMRVAFGYDASVDNMASVASSGTPGESSGSDTSIFNATINNNSYNYFVEVQFEDSNTSFNLVFRNAKITYTTTGL